MKKIVFITLICVAMVMVSCGKSETYTAVEKATTEAMAALDTATSPVSVAQVVALCSSNCNDATMLTGAMKEAEVEQAQKLYDALQVKASAKSDSLTRIILNEMVVTQDIPAEPSN